LAVILLIRFLTEIFFSLLAVTDIVMKYYLFFLISFVL